MKVKVELTKRLAEMAGYPGGSLEVEESCTLGQALSTLTHEFLGADSSGLLKSGELHPAVLVIVDGEACLPGGRDRTLAAGETIGLLLPIAGG